MNNIHKANGCIDLGKWSKSDKYNPKEYASYTRKLIDVTEHTKNRKA